MTTYDTPAPALARSHPSAALTTAVLAGVLLGVVDLMLQRALPYPYANLANSSAVWAVCAFGLGTLLPGRPGLAAVSGAIALAVASEVYYIADLGWAGLLPETLLRPHTLMWVGLGFLAGPVWGAAGAVWRGTTGWTRDAALALAAGVLLGEAMLRDGSTAVITAAAAGAVLLAGCNRPGELTRAAVLTLPLGVACWVAFQAGGFGWG